MKIFDIQNSKVVINENVLLIPYLKKVHDKFGMSALCYLYYMTDPDSPYMNYPEESKEQEILKDYPGEYISDDVYIINALEKLEEMYKTPKYRFWEGLRQKLEEFTNMMKNIPLDIDKETGNFNENIKLFDKIDKLFMAYEKAEKAKDNEIKARGNHKLAYDQK